MVFVLRNAAKTKHFQENEKNQKFNHFRMNMSALEGSKKLNFNIGCKKDSFLKGINIHI